MKTWILLGLLSLGLLAANGGGADLKTASGTKLKEDFQTATFSMW